MVALTPLNYNDCSTLGLCPTPVWHQLVRWAIFSHFHCLCLVFHFIKKKTDDMRIESSFNCTICSQNIEHLSLLFVVIFIAFFAFHACCNLSDHATKRYCHQLDFYSYLDHYDSLWSILRHKTLMLLRVVCLQRILFTA